MITTHDYLVGAPAFSAQLLGSVEQYPYPGCVELRWDAPACGNVAEDTGIALKAGCRFIVLSLLSKELRYYAASEDVSEIDYEIGIIPDAKHACQFAEDYLVLKRDLLDILIPRNVLRARLEAPKDRTIERPSTDMQDCPPFRK